MQCSVSLYSTSGLVIVQPWKVTDAQDDDDLLHLDIPVTDNVTPTYLMITKIYFRVHLLQDTISQMSYVFCGD